MLLRFADVYIDAIRKISGAFFEFPGNSRKGHRFLLEFSESYQLIFTDRPEYPGALCSQMLRLFLFSESYHLVIQKGVSNHVQ